MLEVKRNERLFMLLVVEKNPTTANRSELSTDQHVASMKIEPLVGSLLVLLLKRGGARERIKRPHLHMSSTFRLRCT